MKDWYFSAGDCVCDVRVAGVLVRDEKLLVQREKNGNEYALPGGHIGIGETTVEALIREYKEETGADIRCKNLLWTEECFWEWNGRKVHNIAFYYRIELCEGCDIPENGKFFSQKDNENVLLGWLPVDEIHRVAIYPEFIRQTIDRLDAPTQHFITRA